MDKGFAMLVVTNLCQNYCINKQCFTRYFQKIFDFQNFLDYVKSLNALCCKRFKRFSLYFVQISRSKSTPNSILSLIWKSALVLRADWLEVVKHAVGELKRLDGSQPLLFG